MLAKNKMKRIIFSMKRISVFVFCLLIFCYTATADMFHDYIEYRYQPKLGKITILSSFVCSLKYVDYVSDNWGELAKENIFIHGEHHAGEKRTFKRGDTIGEHKIETVLTLLPPTGSGMGGALPITYLIVTIDGIKKIDCNIGDFPGGSEGVFQIMICPEDDAIFVEAFDYVKGEEICTHFISISDPETITNEYIITSEY